MITKVEVRTVQGGLLSLPLTDVSAGYIVKSIEGVDPVKATLSSSSFAQQDGAQFQSSRLEPRNVLIKLGLEPDWATNTPETLRNRLYTYLMPKTEVDLRFYRSDGLIVDIAGRVESNEAPPFVQEPQADVSIMCFRPEFVDMDDVVISGNTTSGTTETTVTYPGTIESGFEFKLNVNRSLSAFTIYHKLSDGSLRSMDFVGSLISGDVLTISTVRGSKFATLTRAGVDSSLLYGVDPQAWWAQLQPGVNTLRIYATGAAIPYTVTYFKRYGGL